MQIQKIQIKDTAFKMGLLNKINQEDYTDGKFEHVLVLDEEGNKIASYITAVLQVLDGQWFRYWFSSKDEGLNPIGLEIKFKKKTSRNKEKSSQYVTVGESFKKTNPYPRRMKGGI